MSRRVNIRRGGGGGGGGSGDGGGVSYQSILGSNLIALFHSQLGIATVSGNVDTWTDQVGGRVVQAVSAGQRPVYAPDGVLFGGKSVVQCAVAGNKSLIAGGLTGFIAVGQRPWCFLRSRTRAAQTNGDAVSLGSTADGFLTITEDATNTNLVSIFAGAAVIGPLKDTNAHTRSFGFDGTNHQLTVDASTFNVAYAGGIGGANPITRIAIGAIGWSVSGADNTSNESIAAYLICAAQPTAAQRAATIALLNAEFP